MGFSCPKSISFAVVINEKCGRAFSWSTVAPFLLICAGSVFDVIAGTLLQQYLSDVMASPGAGKLWRTKLAPDHQQSSRPLFDATLALGNALMLHRGPLTSTSSIVVENQLLVRHRNTSQKRIAFVAQNKRRTNFEATKLLMFGQRLRHPYRVFPLPIFFVCRVCDELFSSSSCGCSWVGIYHCLPLIVVNLVDCASPDFRDRSLQKLHVRVVRSDALSSPMR